MAFPFHHRRRKGCHRWHVTMGEHAKPTSSRPPAEASDKIFGRDEAASISRRLAKPTMSTPTLSRRTWNRGLPMRRLQQGHGIKDAAVTILDTRNQLFTWIPIWVHRDIASRESVEPTIITNFGIKQTKLPRAGTVTKPSMVIVPYSPRAVDLATKGARSMLGARGDTMTSMARTLTTG